MNGANRIILWQLWRLTRGEILSTVLLQYVLVVVLVLVGQLNALLSGVMTAGIFMMLSFMALLTAASPFWYAAKHNPGNWVSFPLHLDFRQPASTFMLVFLSMAYSCVKVVVIYLLVAVPVRFGLGVPLSLLPFAFWLAVATATVQAALWTPATALGRFWCYSLAIGGTGVSFLAILFTGTNGLEILFKASPQVPDLFQYSPAVYLGLGLTAIASLAVAVAGVDRQRHGEHLFPRLRFRPLIPARPRSRTACRFSGPVQAQVWCEVRRAVLPSIWVPVIAAMLIVLIAVLAAFFPEKDGPGALALIWSLIVFSTVMITQGLAGYGISATRIRDRLMNYSVFEATLPMGTGMLALIKVGAIAASGILAIAILALGTVIGICPLLMQAEWVPFFREGWAQLNMGSGGASALVWIAYGYPIALLVASMPSMAFNTCVNPKPAIPHNKLFQTFLGVAACGIAFLSIVGYRFPLTFPIFWWGLTAWMAGGSVWAVYRAYEGGYLDRRWLIAGSILWAISVGVWGVAMLVAGPPRYSMVLAAEIAMLFMPLMAVAMPPLALAEHRHQ